MKRIKQFWVICLASILLLSNAGGWVTAEETEGIPPYELVRFSEFERDYADETHNLLYGNTLYADWTRADGVESDTGIDVETAYPDREHLRLKLVLELFSSDPQQQPDVDWEQITVKLRSPDVKDKEGDPNLTINGGKDETNSEHNYGWNIRPETVSMQDGRMELSIPLNRPADTSRGLMDWTRVQRILLTLRLKDSVVADGLATGYTMRLSNVQIVNDIMEITRDRIRAAASDQFPEGIVYDEKSLAQFAEVRQQALTLVEDAQATLVQLQDMAKHMATVRAQMVEITYRIADFSRLCGTYPGESYTLYADWIYADGASDGRGVDMSHHDFDRTMLQIELDLQGPEGYDGVWNTDGWVLLRSTGDRLCTYGWQLAADDPAIGRLHTGRNRLSIPLSASSEDGYTVLKSDETVSDDQGEIDWTAINRLHVYLAPQGYQKGDFTMTITMARVVDMTQADEAMTVLERALQGEWPNEQDYTPASWQIYREARQAAEDVQAAYPYVDAATILSAADEMTRAAAALEEKPTYQPGDVDGENGVTAADALMTLQAATDKITLTGTALLAADVDGQEGVTAADALLILQMATGKIVSSTV